VGTCDRGCTNWPGSVSLQVLVYVSACWHEAQSSCNCSSAAQGESQSLYSLPKLVLNYSYNVKYVDGITKSALDVDCMYKVDMVPQYTQPMCTCNVAMLKNFLQCCILQALRLSGNVLQQLSPAAVTKLSSTDPQCLADSTQYLHTVWSSPLLVCVLLALLAREIGALPTAACIAGVLAAGVTRLREYIAESRFVCRSEQREQLLDSVTGSKSCCDTADKCSNGRAPGSAASDQQLNKVRCLHYTEKLLVVSYDCVQAVQSHATMVLK
jgi:hypothetical protein